MVVPSSPAIPKNDFARLVFLPGLGTVSVALHDQVATPERLAEATRDVIDVQRRISEQPRTAWGDAAPSDAHSPGLALQTPARPDATGTERMEHGSGLAEFDFSSPLASGKWADLMHSLTPAAETPSTGGLELMCEPIAHPKENRRLLAGSGSDRQIRQVGREPEMGSLARAAAEFTFGGAAATAALEEVKHKPGGTF